MPKGNGIPKMPSQEEEVRLELCAAMSLLFESATCDLDLKSSIALYKALGDEIDHCVAVFKREQRWVELVKLLGKNAITEQEAQTILALMKRQGLNPEVMD